MTITRVTEAQEIETVESLAHEIWREHYTQIIGRPQVDYMLRTFQSESAIRQQQNDGYLYYLMTDSDGALGYMSVLPENDHLFLSKFYIQTLKRNRGHAREAMAFLEMLAIQYGLHKITLTVNKENIIAISTYERLGFIDMGEIVQDIGHGFVMDDFKMQKVLLRAEHT